MSLREQIGKRMASALEGARDAPASTEGIRRLAAVCTDAALAALRPVEAVEGAEPLILYFPTEEDREEFIAAVHAAKPGMVPVSVD